jgi:hypothetical protein
MRDPKENEMSTEELLAEQIASTLGKRAGELGASLVIIMIAVPGIAPGSHGGWYAKYSGGFATLGLLDVGSKAVRVALEDKALAHKKPGDEP